MTLYEVLGVSERASAAEIKAAHREAVKIHHPDAGGDPQAFVRAQRAYAVLSDPERRARYDATGLEDDPTAADEQRAYAVVGSLLLQIVDGAGDLDRADVLGEVRRTLAEQEASHTAARRKVEARIERLRLLRRRLRRDTPGQDALAAIVSERETLLEAAWSREGEALRLIAMALEVLRNYSYSLDPTSPDEAAIWSALKEAT